MKQILTIDGGGIRGALTSCFLVELEKQIGKSCREVFSMVAGTSTGALIAAAIAAGIPATQILEIYTKRCSEIFNLPAPLVLPERLAKGHAFDSHNIAKVLRSVLGPAADWTLNDCPIQILLTAMHVDATPAYFVKDTLKNGSRYGKLSLVDCAVASAAAPTYLSPWYVSPLSGELVGWCVDGGVGVTGNPVHRACVEAFHRDSFDPLQTHVISLGTGYYPNTEVNPPSGIIATLSMLINCLLQSPDDEQTELVDLYYPGVMSRFNWHLPSAIDMADVSSIPGLVQLGTTLASQMDWASILK